VKPVHRSRDLLALDVARDLKQRGFPTDIERIEAAAAKLLSAEEEKALDARVEEALRMADRLIQAMRDVDAPLEDWRDAAATQRKRQAADIRREIVARADELRRGGARTPVAQAEKEIAEQLGHASGPALNKWLRRHR
jgi:hypothetical protein